MFENNKNWERSKERFEALWNVEQIDRPTVCIQVDTMPHMPTLIERLPPEEVRRAYMDEAFIHDVMEERMTRNAFFGDAFPNMSLYLGTCAHGAYTKKVNYSISSDSVWLHPVMDDITDTLEFDENSEFLHATSRIIDHLAARSNGRFVIANTDNCSNLDALASLRGISDLLLDMTDEPEAVDKCLDTLHDILKRTEEQFAAPILAANENGTTTEFMQLWSSGYHHQMQCDMAAMISPAMFERFAVNDLERCAAWMGRVVYHLDGQEQIRVLDQILGVKGINLVQWTPVAGQPPTSAFIPELQRIQAAGKGLVLFPKAAELPTLLENLAPKGLHFCPVDVQTEDEARAIMRLFEK